MNIGSLQLQRWINESHGLEFYPDIQIGPRGNENGILFLAELFIIKKLRGELTEEDKFTFEHIVERIQTYGPDGNQIKGLYDRGAGESFTCRSTNTQDKLRTISHDNLTAIAGFSKLVGLRFAKHISDFGHENHWIFDNAYPEKPRLLYRKKDGTWASRLHMPRDWAFWSLCGGKKLTWLMWCWWLFIANIATCFGDETSGKWLMFVRCESTKESSWLMKVNSKICYWLLRRKYGKNWLHEIAKIYFNYPEHPILELSKLIQL